MFMRLVWMFGHAVSFPLFTDNSMYFEKQLEPCTDGGKIPLDVLPRSAVMSDMFWDHC